VSLANWFILLNNVVDVAFNLLIDNIELVDKLFKLLNIVVDVVLILLIDNIELVDKLFKLLNIVVDVVFKLLRFEFIANTDKPDVVILPTTFNDDNNVVALFNVVVPDTFNDDINVVVLFNLVVPDTFNDDNNVVILFNVVVPETFNVDDKVDDPEIIEVPPISNNALIVVVLPVPIPTLPPNGFNNKDLFPTPAIID
jgi:hypothetical protein